MNIPKHRSKLRLTWRRHRVMVGKAISLASLLGLLANTVFLAPISQAAPAAAPLLGPVQSPWVSADIGSVGVAGSADETNGIFTINGSGADIGGTADSFHYVYQPLADDGSIEAQITSQTTPNFWSRTGLMMRGSLSADSPHVTVAVMSQASRVHTYQRGSAGSTTTTYADSTPGAAPIWLKLERAGSTITTFRSTDGVNWTQLQSLSTTMSGTIYVGMAVTSRINGTLSTATFEDVSVNGSSPPPPPTCSYGPYDMSQNSRVEAEDFRCGGEGVAFHEDLTADTGPGSGIYRTDVSTEGPDLQTTTDVGGGYNLGWMRPGEWLEYEVIAPQAGDYEMTIRFALEGPGTADLRLTTSQGSTQLGDSGVLNFGATGGSQIWVDHVVTLPLAAGTNTVRLAIEGGRANINYIDMVPVSPPPPPQQEVIVQRKSYSIGGQAVANRVVTFVEGLETDNQVYYIHGDHLGSVSVLTKMSDGYVVNDSKAYYTPFGDFRLQPTSDLTDMGYTGHLGNNTGSNDIGLIYMNARYYVPSVGRFASADTIVPKATIPQSFNRYSYTNNNPLVYTDPSGHCLQYTDENGYTDEYETCMSAWNELSHYFSVATSYDLDAYPLKYMQSLMENATIEELHSHLSNVGITYDERRKDYSWSGYDLNKGPMSGCIALQGGMWNCPPEGGWPKYYPGTKEFVKKFIIKAVVSVVAGPVVRKVTGLKGVVGGFINWLITREIKQGINEAIDKSFDESAPPPLTTDMDPSENYSNPVNNQLWSNYWGLNTSTVPWSNQPHGVSGEW